MTDETTDLVDAICTFLQLHHEAGTDVRQARFMSPQQNKRAYVARPIRYRYVAATYYEFERAPTDLFWIMHPDQCNRESSWYITDQLELVNTTTVRIRNGMVPWLQRAAHIVDRHDLEELSDPTLTHVWKCLSYTLGPVSVTT